MNKNWVSRDTKGNQSSLKIKIEEPWKGRDILVTYSGLMKESDYKPNMKYILSLKSVMRTIYHHGRFRFDISRRLRNTKIWWRPDSTIIVTYNNETYEYEHAALKSICKYIWFDWYFNVLITLWTLIYIFLFYWGTLCT